MQFNEAHEPDGRDAPHHAGITASATDRNLLWKSRAQSSEWLCLIKGLTGAELGKLPLGQIARHKAANESGRSSHTTRLVQLAVFSPIKAHEFAAEHGLPTQSLETQKSKENGGHGGIRTLEARKGLSP